MFDRYNIANENDQREALRATAAYRQQRVAQPEKITVMPQQSGESSETRTVCGQSEGARPSEHPQPTERMAPQVGLEPTTLRLTVARMRKRPITAKCY